MGPNYISKHNIDSTQINAVDLDIKTTTKLSILKDAPGDYVLKKMYTVHT